MMAADEAARRSLEVAERADDRPPPRSAWADRGPREPPVRDDRRLFECRDPAERPALTLAVGLVVIIVVFLFRINDTVSAVMTALVLFWIGLLLYDLVEEVQFIANSAEVTPTQCAFLYPIVEELRRRWAMPHTRVLVVYQPGLGVVASGFKEPYIIRIDSLYARSLDDAELRYVLGREMAHIKFGHARWWMLLGGSEREVPGVLALLGKPRNVIFAWWRRAQRTSADRAGILACGDVGKAISALVKYQVGPSVAPEVSVETLGMQAVELTHGWERWAAVFGQMLNAEPYLLYRIRLMVEWAGLPAVRQAPAGAADGGPLADSRDAATPDG